MKTRNLISCLLLTATFAHAAATEPPPKFEEIYQLLRTNLGGVNAGQLNRDAIKGLLEQLPGEAVLVGTNGEAAESADAKPLEKTALYDNAFAYFRVGNVSAPLAGKLQAAYREFTQNNKTKVKGVILDLRFAGGNDYTAAGTMANCFLDSDQPLLEWGTGSASATKKTNAISLPVAILVNSKTTGAAEALAAALREGNIGLILGETTAGHANIFKEFPLGNGEKLRIAIAQIKLGDGEALSHGVKPDIAVKESLTDEKAYLEDPYKILHPATSGTNDAGATVDASVDQSPRRPTNEAELVRQKKAGISDDGSDDSEDQSAIPATPAPPVIADATLARALDLLKGLAVLQLSHPG